MTAFPYDTPPDYVGRFSVPLPASAPGTPISDPPVEYFLAFLQAFVNANSNAAWGAPASIYPEAAGNLAPGNGLAIFHTFTFDPQVGAFDPSSLPALFAWRSEETPERPADSWRTQEAKVALRWVLPELSATDLISNLHPFFTQFAKLFRVAMERGQDPSWVVAGDPDPKAATQGSVLVRWMSACGRWPWLSPWTRLSLPIADKLYPSYATTLNFTERYVLNTGRQFNRTTSGTPPVTPDQVKIQTPDDGYGDGGLVLGVQNLRGP